VVVRWSKCADNGIYQLNAALRIAEQIASKQQTQAEIKLEKQVRTSLRLFPAV
jgi:hypothetical protein